MLYQVGLLGCLLLMTCASVKEFPMTDQPLSVQVKCRGNDPCLFDGNDLWLDIEIANTGTGQIGFPLAFMQKKGPIIRLIDSRTGADTHLRTNPADFSLLDQLTPVPAGHPIRLEWVIMAHEVRQFGGQFVDLSAEVTVMAPIRANGGKVEFQASDTIRIRDKNQP